MYKLLLVDEENDVFESFLDYWEASTIKSQFEILTQYPLGNLKDMVQTILEINPDAIITDFMLNAIKTDIKYNVPYNGSTLVNEFTSFREGFPCFILTSFDDQAINQSSDVNIVYIKNLLHKNVETASKAHSTFLERVKSQIDHYRKRIDDAEKELKDLVGKRKNGDASIKDEQRLIELDTFLEIAVDKGSFIPPEYKTLSNTDRLNSLLSKVDDLLNKIDKGDA